MLKTTVPISGLAGLLFFVCICDANVILKLPTEFRTDNPFEPIASKWLSNVNSYRYRFEIHGLDDKGNEQVLFLEASGDERDHTVVVEYDRNGVTKNIVMTNPQYIATIQPRGNDYVLVELRENSPTTIEQEWTTNRGIDPYFVATTMFFLMRTKEMAGLKRVRNDHDSMEWVPISEVAIDEGRQRLSKVIAIASDGDITEVRLTTELMNKNTIYSKTTKANFDSWSDIGGTRIPLVAKYFLNDASRPYTEFRVASPSDIAINSPFEERICFLAYYGLPEPGIQTASSGLSGWWFWGAIVIGGLLIFVPIVVRRRWSR